MSGTYVKAWLLGTVVLILIVVSGVSAFSYVNMINYENQTNNLKSFLIYEKENHNETKWSLKKVLYTLNKTIFNLTEKANELNHAYNKISSLSIENSNVTFSLKNTKQNLNETKKNLDIMYNETENLTYEVSLLQNKTLYNPTYNEVVLFLENDTINKNPYKGQYIDYINWTIRNYTEYYVCLHFANDLIKNVVVKNIKCGFVELTCYNITYDIWWGHAMVAFNTIDRGVIFVEPQTDEIFFNLHETGYYWDDWIYDLTITWLGK